VSKVEDFVELIGQIAQRAGLTALYTPGPKPDMHDLVIYLEPEMVNELLRIRYVRGELEPRYIAINRKVWDRWAAEALL